MRPSASALFVLTLFLSSCATLSTIRRRKPEKAIPLEALQEAPEGATVGIYAVSMRNGREIASYNADKLLLPASNLKLLVLYAALDLLGPAKNFRTEFLLDDSLNLYMVGFGDPSLLASDLYMIAERIKAFGINRIMDIRVSESFYDTIRYGPGWMWDEGPHPYAAPVSALSLNRNVVEVWVRNTETGPVAEVVPATDFVRAAVEVTPAESLDKVEVERSFDTVNNITLRIPEDALDFEPHVKYVSIEEPALFAGHVLKGALERSGMEVEGKVLKGDPPPDASLIYTWLSPPLFELLYDMEKYSLNFYSEMILKYIGAEFRGPPGTWSKGLSVLKQFIYERGLDTSGVRIADGSGLSRYNLLTPRFIVQILASVYENFSIMPEFLSALPVAGRDGTLAMRFLDTPLEDNLRAKTGTMTGVSALSGYMYTEKGDLLAFSIIINNYTSGGEKAKSFEEKLLEALYESD
ncbi:MAG: D-alanyl-D-alanine carboxypeptidase/D-alanyl-D-alanine-endopeptidase [Candidatus Hydrothermae bacterium]|nr:D-alanyl-D-alanine carboxypeptidase/D-alanyl-D-alanine-endopeptidase [Candidatus Hydrothermae bacterium]